MLPHLGKIILPVTPETILDMIVHRRGHDFIKGIDVENCVIGFDFRSSGVKHLSLIFWTPVQENPRACK